MRRMLTLFLLPLIITVVSPRQQFAQWVETKGPLAGYVHAMAVHGDSILAAVRGNTPYVEFIDSGEPLYKSTDGGTTWIQTSTTPKTFRSLAIAAGILLAATNSDGLLRSEDNGATWTQMPDHNIYLLAAHGTDFYAAGDSMYLSTDLGSTWTASTMGIPRLQVSSFAFCNNYVFAGTRNGVFRSADKGKTWTATSTGLADTTVTSLAASTDGTHIFAGTLSGISGSTNGGITWAATNPDFGGSGISSLTIAGTVLLAGPQSGGIFRSTDNGMSWMYASKRLARAVVTSMLISGPAVYAGTQGGGIYLSTDSGMSWNSTGIGPEVAEVKVLAPVLISNGTSGSDGIELFAGTFGSGAFVSSDSGATWKSVNHGLQNPFMTNIAADGAGIFAGSGSIIFRSTDTGVNWSQAGTLPGLSTSRMSVRCLSFGPPEAAGRILLAGVSDYGVFISSDSGAHWTSSNNGLPLSSHGYPPTVQHFAIGGSDIFAATVDRGIFRSTDNGISWTQAGLQDTSVFCLAVNGERIYAGTEWGVSVSTDRGEHWADALTRRPGLTPVRSLTLHGSTVIAGTHGDGIFLSTDGGAGWTQANSGLGEGTVFSGARYIESLAQVGPYIVAGTYEGAWRCRLSDLASLAGQPSPEAPGGFALSQNYPNPFNPTTVIKYTVEENRDQGMGLSGVKITVYDVLGREVAVLVNERKAPGSYEVRFSARGGSASGGGGSGLASGVYIYRLTAGSFSQARTMVLIR